MVKYVLATFERCRIILIACDDEDSYFDRFKASSRLLHIQGRFDEVVLQREAYPAGSWPRRSSRMMAH